MRIPYIQALHTANRRLDYFADVNSFSLPFNQINNRSFVKH
jgi:hypothetical protein